MIDYLRISAIEASSNVRRDTRHREQPISKRDDSYHAHGTEFDDMFHASIDELRKKDKKGNIAMSNEYDKMPPEERRKFDEGYDAWKHETGQDIVTDEDVDDMYTEYLKDHPEEAGQELPDDGLMGLDFESGTEPSNPFLDKVMEGKKSLPMGKQIIIKDARQMISQRIADIQQNIAMAESEVSAMESQQSVITNYWEREGLSERDGVPAYVASELGFDGTPSEYADMVANKKSEIEESTKAELDEFFSQIYEADRYTSKSENGMPILIGSDLRHDLNAAFDNAYEAYETKQFDSFLNASRKTHDIAAGTSINGVAIDYTRDVQMETPSVEKTVESEKTTNREEPKKVPTKQTGVPHRGMDIYNTATENDDWSYDEFDRPSSGDMGK